MLRRHIFDNVMTISVSMFTTKYNIYLRCSTITTVYMSSFTVYDEENITLLVGQMKMSPLMLFGLKSDSSWLQLLHSFDWNVKRHLMIPLREKKKNHDILCYTAAIKPSCANTV